MKVLLFGAGASIRAGYPSAKNLMQTIEKDATEHLNDMSLAEAWGSWVSVRDKAEPQPPRLQRMLNHENPEIVLSLLDLYEEALGSSDLTTKSTYVAARDGLLSCLREYFEMRHAADCEDSEQRSYLKQKLGELQDGDVVVTFNWDTIVERTLLEMGRWSPINGYGFAKKLKVGTSHFEPLKPLPRNVVQTKILVLKPHGWYSSFSDSHQTLYFDYWYFLHYFPFPTETLHAFDPDSPEYGPPERPVIAYPSFLKKLRGPEMQQIWYRAGRALSRAHEVDIWGYSLPESDAAVRALLNVLRFRLKRKLAVVSVHDPDYNTRMRWRNFLGDGVKLCEQGF
jgi:hypothetical protein